MKKTIIQTKDLTKTFFTDNQSLNAVDHMNLEIYEEDFTVIMGSSGSGKSSLLYALSGLDEITSGEILFNGLSLLSIDEKEIAKFRREEIGFVFQTVNLIPHLSLFDNVAIAGYLSNRAKIDVQKDALDLLSKVGLLSEKDRLPSMVSGGQAQRAAIARSLINQPRVIFADEPTGSLNSKASNVILNLLSKINSEFKKTIVMVTHDIKASLRANRILFLKDGKIEGDLSLAPYSEGTQTDREKIILAYLENRGW
jgi:putative ABC transport system ATP-binding protein